MNEPRVLFVSNGHGEAAIAARLAAELRVRVPFQTDHLALVGDKPSPTGFVDVGPRRSMPSGGLVAMGNVRAFVGDLRAGFTRLWFEQRAFLISEGRRYSQIVAVGDVYALLMSFFARRPVTFVGTAKSLYVAPYGPLERRLLCRAVDIFVRDEPTAAWLRKHRVPAHAPGNVIVDLLDVGEPLPAPDPPMLALFPGSRMSAYGDAVKLAAVARRVLEQRREYSAVLSVAPTLSVSEVVNLLRANDWEVQTDDAVFAFRAHHGNVVIHGCTGELAPLLRLASIVVGQAGTGNEAAAAAGVPVVALAASEKLGWLSHASRPFARRSFTSGARRCRNGICGGDGSDRFARSACAYEQGRSRTNGPTRRDRSDRGGHRCSAEGVKTPAPPPSVAWLLAVLWAGMPLYPSFIALLPIAPPGLSLLGPLPALVLLCCVGTLTGGVAYALWQSSDTRFSPMAWCGQWASIF